MSSALDRAAHADLPRFRPEGLELLKRAVWVLEAQSKRKVFANAAALELWGAESEAELFARDFNPHSPAIRRRLGQTLDRIANGEVIAERWTFYPRDNPVTVDCLMSGVRLADGRVGMLVEAVSPDIAPEERRAVEALRHTLVKVTLYGSDGRVLFRNPAAAEVYPDPDHSFVKSFADPEEGGRVWKATLLGSPSQSNAFMGQAVSGVFRMAGGDGVRWHALDARSTSDPISGQPCVLVNERDVTEQTRARERIDYLAMHDAVTGLANRGHFMDRLNQAMAMPAASGGLVLIDLDGFKEINDTRGHAVGDAVLRETGARLRSIVRPDDVGARLGGDEFAVILPGLSDPQTLRRRAEEMLLRLGQPVEEQALGGTGGGPVAVRASIGIAAWPADGDTPEALQRNADLALYLAKAGGGDTCRFFDSAMRRAVDDRRELIEALHTAIDYQEFEVHYQPLVTLGDLRVDGLEALVRWRRPNGALVLPDRFIPVAETAGLMPAIGRIVIEAAVRQMREWLDRGLDPGRVAINLGSSQLRNRDFAAVVNDAVNEFGLPTSRFEFEVPETVTFGRGGEEVIGVLCDLRRLGFGLALDDFGTGHASLTHLRRLPVDKIKIDRSFITGMNHSAADLAIVRAIVNLGHDLGMTVLAEGIETAAQASTLGGLGCDLGQGFLFGRGMPGGETTSWLRSRPSMSVDRGLVVTLPAAR